MIPRFYKYVRQALGHYPEFADFLELLERPECAP
jgi:aminoglycoside/choline kinase family phosphotransferase